MEAERLHLVSLAALTSITSGGAISIVRCTHGNNATATVARVLDLHFLWRAGLRGMDAPIAASRQDSDARSRKSDS